MKGRPKGAKNFAKSRSWQPVIWHPYYEDVIGLHVDGVSNIAIAEKFSVHPVQISNILNTDKGRSRIAELQEIKRKVIEESISYRHEELQKTAFARVEAVLKNDELFEESPFAVFDRSMMYLKSTAKGNELPIQAEAPSTVVVNNTFLQIVSEGLKKLEEIVPVKVIG